MSQFTENWYSKLEMGDFTVSLPNVRETEQIVKQLISSAVKDYSGKTKWTFNSKNLIIESITNAGMNKSIEYQNKTLEVERDNSETKLKVVFHEESNGENYKVLNAYDFLKSVYEICSDDISNLRLDILASTMNTMIFDNIEDNFGEVLSAV